ncbi:hypothetical protein [Bradyrhizobium canariense]|uniref:hypothetical protein n=1 Tax=Bradyrhizobium canariense TaxID=255045 RepID=UPI001F0B6ACA|nr:hypothetical protein [Bradyrhizobium canariense]
MRAALFVALIVATGTATATHAKAADIKSISRIEFGPANVLFVADWQASAIDALTLPAMSPAAARTFNIRDLGSLLEKQSDGGPVHVTDMKVRPGTGVAYVAYEFGRARKPGLAWITPDGQVHKVDLGTAKAAETKLKDATDSDNSFWGRIPQRSLTVTTMKWHDRELFVAGLSNQTFASSLWRLRFPFESQISPTSIEIYHTSHDQWETRAPIREMAFADLEAKSYLVAAYMCTPLVTIPLDEIKSGAHIRGKTIAELGYGNTPSDMVSYVGTEQGKKVPYVLLTNYERSADLIPVSSIAESNKKPGFEKPVPWGNITGVDLTYLPLSGVTRIDNLDDKYLIVVRQDPEEGKTQLVTFNKDVRLRVTDFVSEYDFPDYKYPKGYQSTYIKPIEDTLIREEGVQSPSKP